jgi:MoaA/NifB/PqqE/SkfB family radical SAM enzyme
VNETVTVIMNRTPTPTPTPTGEVIPTPYCNPKCTYCTSSHDDEGPDRLVPNTGKIKTGSRKLKYMENDLPQ